MAILDEAKKMKEEIKAWRRELHKNPEVGLFLPETKKCVLRALKDMGIDGQEFSGHSGVVAVIGKGEGPCVGIRADMDALPMQEETGLPYQSSNQNMHACGHDAHAAMLLGAAKLLKKRENELSGKVKLIFQPSEEYMPSGAVALMEDGVLENPKVDALLAMHVTPDANPNYRSGDILIKYGSVCTAVDSISLRIIGRGGHGSMPHLCVDPIAIGTMLINNLQYVISREINPQRIAVISFGSVQAGQGGDNIIPDEVTLLGTLRTADSETRSNLMKRIEEVVDATCRMMRAEYQLEIGRGCPAVQNDRTLTEKVQKSAEEIFEADSIRLESEIWMASEDFSFFLEDRPGCYLRLFCPKADSDGKCYALHNGKFNLDDDVLYRGSALFAKAAIDLMEE